MSNFIIKSLGFIVYGDRDTQDPKAIEQAYQIKDSGIFDTSLIAIMPDYHVGKGCVIGFTGRLKDLVCPNIIGVDIGCGVTSMKLPYKKEIPSEVLRSIHSDILKSSLLSRKQEPDSFRLPLIEDIKKAYYPDVDSTLNSLGGKAYTQFGTLGSGNHFIEIGRGTDDYYWITVHSGSRGTGADIARRYQAEAEKLCSVMKVPVSRDLSYFPIDSYIGERYLAEMRQLVAYASYNRRVILNAVSQIVFSKLQENLTRESCRGTRLIESIHNYIDTDGMVRKGAISAREGEPLVIPMNMAEGVIIGTGKGNKNWNNSAPHGLGRLTSRSAFVRSVKDDDRALSSIKDTLQGVVCNPLMPVLDETPQAYKSSNSVIPHLADSVDIECVVKSVLNVKG